MFTFQAEDILKVHSRVCPKFEKNTQISVDGVCESKSSTVSIDVYSIKFKNCRCIYPHKIVRPIKKGYIDNKEQLRNFIQDLNDNSIIIDTVIADNLKRSNMKGSLCHSALFPCEYCYAKGVKYSEKKSKVEKQEESHKTLKEKIKRIENLKERGNKKTLKILKDVLFDLEKDNNRQKSKTMTVWPSSTANKELRTKENILEIVSLIENQEDDDENDPLSKDDLKGVASHSVLLDLPYFDFVNNVPTEYMHLGCLGVVKRLTELTFNMGLNRKRITNRKLSSTKQFNYLMSLTKVVFEFSRRSRDLDFSLYKAEEYRNLILFFFPHVLSCLENSDKEYDLWLYLAFMIRSCVIPDSEYFNINVNQISHACHRFYKIYEKIFGPVNCSYSIHVLCCHLPQIRQLGPLTETSAFKFESFYGEIRNCFFPGTPNTLKQIFERVMLKRSLGTHSCQKDICLSNYDTAMECNSLVYTYIDDEFYFYKIIDPIEDDEILCNPQGKFLCEFKETPELSWSSIGVFKKGPTSTDIVKVPHKSIAGKVLKVGDYLITCPENVLKEK